MWLGTEFNYPPPDNGEPRYVIDDTIMISAIICLFIVAFLLCLLYVYFSWFSAQPTTSFTRTRRRSASTVPRFYFTGNEPEMLRNVGLDSVILETLPIFLYKSQNFTDGLECAVCLCAFEENEKGRLLPNCRHSFHVECIDMWFRSHSTCPLCRTAAQPEVPVLELATVEQVSVTISGPITLGSQDHLNLEQAVQTASRGEDCNQQNLTNRFSWGDRQKQMKTEMDEGISGRRSAMPQIAIDIPKKPDGFNSFSGEGHQPFSPNSSQRSSKSPVTRLRSLTKMVSRDRARTQVFDRSPELTVNLSSGDREGAQVCPSHRPAECVVENNEG